MEKVVCTHHSIIVVFHELNVMCIELTIKSHLYSDTKEHDGDSRLV